MKYLGEPDLKEIGMRIEKVIADLQRMLSNEGRYRDLTLSVVVNMPGSIGGTPRVALERVQAGFDWDAGVVLLYPEKPLSLLSPEQLVQLGESARAGQSWHALEAHKKLRSRIVELENEVKSLSAVSQEDEKTAKDLRAACVKLRRTSMPLADMIPLMQRAADALAGPDADLTKEK
jgi:hypothetical protein